MGAIQEEQDADPQPAEPQPSATKRKAAGNYDAKPQPKAQKKAPASGVDQWQANRDSPQRSTIGPISWQKRYCTPSCKADIGYIHEPPLQGGCCLISPESAGRDE